MVAQAAGSDSASAQAAGAARTAAGTGCSSEPWWAALPRREMRGRQVFIGVSSTGGSLCGGRSNVVGDARGRSGRRGRVAVICLGG
jgi:hypothetical protein